MPIVIDVCNSVLSLVQRAIEAHATWRILARHHEQVSIRGYRAVNTSLLSRKIIKWLSFVKVSWSHGCGRIPKGLLHVVGASVSIVQIFLTYCTYYYKRSLRSTPQNCGLYQCVENGHIVWKCMINGTKHPTSLYKANTQFNMYRANMQERYYYGGHDPLFIQARVDILFG